LAASGQQKSPPQEVIETGSDKCKNMQNESLSSELAIIGIRVSITISIRQTVEDVWPTGLAGIWWGSWSTHKLCKMIYKQNGKSENRTT